jgi:transaldolase/transaldolase/glucose-6-phosphate isomerase
LWASTSAKDPAFSDVKYVEALIGQKTINTLPVDTIAAFRDHGNAASTLIKNLDQTTKILEQLKENNIDLDLITQKLEDEGIKKFNASFEALLKVIETQREKSNAKV